MEKAKVHEEFEGKELDDIKRDYKTALEGCHDLLSESLASIKSGRASTKIFDDIEVKAYGDVTPFCDVAQTMVQGNNNLIVKVYDETVLQEVLKSLQRSDFDLQCQLEGKDIRVKLGTSKKEHIIAALKKVKEANDSFKKDVREARHNALQTLKKLGKILPQDQIKLLEDEFELLVKKAEEAAKKECDAKEKEINA